MQAYFRSLFNPFDPTLTQPKIADGRAVRSAGLRLRHTGSINCPLDGTPVTLMLIPGFENAWAAYDGTDVIYPDYFTSHLSDADSPKVNKLRVVGTGLKIQLINSALESEGFWEAARVPFNASDFTIVATDASNNWRVSVASSVFTGYTTNLAQYSTYQTGKLRDIHRVLFKLNSTNVDHEFLSPTALIDNTWDVIVIKFTPRISASVPTVLKLHAVSNQEVIYNEKEALARLMSYNQRVDRNESILQRANVMMPGIPG